MLRMIVVGLMCTIMGTTVGFAATNVALNKPVTLNGVFFIGGWPSGDIVSADTVVDGLFFTRHHQWDLGPVWWDSSGVNTGQSIVIDLEGVYTIESFIVQADDNDAYKLYYWDFGSSDWVLAWDVPNYDEVPDPANWGMQTRPNPDDDTERYVLASPIVTNALKIEGNTSDTGDSFFSVSEIQAFGSLLVEFTKEIAATTEDGDMDGVIETGEDWWWTLSVSMKNLSDETLTITKLHDRLGGDLHWHILSYYSFLIGDADLYTRGKTNKWFLNFYDGFTLAPDQEEWLFSITVSPDVNTGTGNDKKAGHQEFTSAGEHCLNSGAWFEGYIGDEYIEATTNPVCVEVFDAD
jgi:hypothetical protein